MDRFTITASEGSKKNFALFHHEKGVLPKRMTAAKFVCSAADCDQSLVGNNSVLFNCPSCTSKMTAGETRDLQASDLQDLKQIAVCAFCDTGLLTANSDMPNFEEGKLYCPVCTDPVAVKADESDENEDDKKSDDSDAEQTDMEPDADSLPEGEDESDAETMTNPDADPDADPEADPDAGDTSEDPEEEGDSDDEENDEEEDDEENDEGDDTESDDEEDTDPESEKDKAVTAQDKGKKGKTNKPAEKLLTSVLAAVGDKEVDIDLIATADRKKWFLMADNVPVAVAEPSRCSEGVREHFQTDKYAAAYHAATQEAGVTPDILNEFGFQEIKTEVPVDEAVRQQVEAQVQERTRAFNLSAADYSQRANRCFGLAAMGLTKGTWADKNPVQTALVASLQRLGVHDAHNIVAKEFEKHSPAMLKTLFLRAENLMEKDDSALEEVATIVQEQELPSARNPKPGIPPAAMTMLDEDRVENAKPAAVTASEDDNSGYDNIFALRRKIR